MSKVLARDSDTAFMTPVGLQAFWQDNEGENQKESENDQVLDRREAVEASDAVAPNCQMWQFAKFDNLQKKRCQWYNRPGGCVPLLTVSMKVISVKEDKPQY